MRPRAWSLADMGRENRSLERFSPRSGGGGIRTLEPPNRRLTVFETFAMVSHYLVPAMPRRTDRVVPP
jgi:hypothetical protein